MTAQSEIQTPDARPVLNNKSVPCETRAALRAQTGTAMKLLATALDQANKASHRRLLASYIPNHLDEVYAGLVSVVVRMMFVLFAETHGLLPMESDTYRNDYSLTALLSPRGRRTAESRPITWTRLLKLFRLLFDDTPNNHGLRVPSLRNRIFDPNAYPFLEGRAQGSACSDKRLTSELIPHEVLRHILSLLTNVDGERIEYASLDVEELGASYEGLIGLELVLAKGCSVVVAPHDVLINLEALLATSGSERVGFVSACSGLVLGGKRAQRLRDATTIEHLRDALGRQASSADGTMLQAGDLVIQAGDHRRHSGSHYTARTLTRVMVERCLAPLLAKTQSPEDILSLRICDPAMGAGAFLLEACRHVARHLIEAWKRNKCTPTFDIDGEIDTYARRLVAQNCLYGVDKNPIAVDVARVSMGLLTFRRDHPLVFLEHALRCGDSLMGLSCRQIESLSFEASADSAPEFANHLHTEEYLRSTILRRSQAMACAARGDLDASRLALDQASVANAELKLVGDLIVSSFLDSTNPKDRKRALRELPATLASFFSDKTRDDIRARVEAFRAKYPHTFHWELEFPEIFDESRGGFDAFVGNPPWVSYAGRAAQPLSDEMREYYARISPAFGRYLNLQGIFIHRCATMLRPAGRLGLIVPTSMSDLLGYRPSRQAHDELCACDSELPDFGTEEFDGVFQPCMGLLSTRRSAREVIQTDEPWPLARADLDANDIAIVQHLASLPKLSPSLFGERGFQSLSEDLKHLHALTQPEGTYCVGVRVGADVEPFRAHGPKLFCDPSVFGGRFRGASVWESVRVLIRQTARYPMAALADGAAFRNSVLAGFEDDIWSAYALMAYLNSAPIRWYHYMSHRDARQGMPQLKIMHLRALPGLDRSSPYLEALDRLGQLWGGRNSGIDKREQEELNRLVANALNLDATAREKLASWQRTIMGG